MHTCIKDKYDATLEHMQITRTYFPMRKHHDQFPKRFFSLTKYGEHSYIMVVSLWQPMMKIKNELKTPTK